MAFRTPDPSLKWAKAIKSRDPETVLELYHPDGVLWATLSPVIRHGKPAIHDYFVGFLNRDALECKFTHNQVRDYGDFMFHSGSYVFTWEAGRYKLKVPARFSFVYKREDDRWLIMEHHSSLFPELPFKGRKYIVKDEIR
jgi:uncharacterized protein (TIGR02246 family)